MKSLNEKVVDTLTVVVAICTLLLTGMLLIERAVALLDQRSDGNRRVHDYEAYAASGHRTGPADAPVTIVEWGDYQCPACRRFEPILKSVLAAFPNEVSAIYRHWPLPNHDRAYPAARAAECAADQGVFRAYHDQLYGSSDWLTGADVVEELLSLGTGIGMPDLDRFNDCISATQPHSTVEADIAAVNEVGGRGTPTILVNDIHVAGVPDSVELSTLIEEALGR